MNDQVPEGGVASALRYIHESAPSRDRTGAFPREEIAQLGTCGALTAPLPTALGGRGFGSERGGGARMLGLLEAVGAASLPVGRLFEGHVNALNLILISTLPTFPKAATVIRSFIITNWR